MTALTFRALTVSLSDEKSWRELDRVIETETGLRATGSRLLQNRKGQLPWLGYLDHLGELQHREKIIVLGAFVRGTVMVDGDDRPQETLVGWLTVRAQQNPVKGHIAIAVHPDYRRRGYATELVRHGLGVLSEAGITKAAYITRQTNPSQEIAVKLGGTLTRTIRREQGENLLVFSIRTRPRRKVIQWLRCSKG
jgi:predicted acetyltransferase